jgi:quinol monooxygenase YgiN
MRFTDGHVSWHVELAVKPGELDNFRALTREMVEFARSEAGVVVYERFVSPDGNDVHVYERWVDSPAALTHLQAFGEQFGARFSSMVERKRFTVYGTPSDELKRVLDRFGATTYLRPFGGFSRYA